MNNQLNSLLLTIIFSYAAHSGATSIASTGTELSIAGGANWYKTPNTQFGISAYEVDSVVIKDVSTQPLWKLGLGHAFFEQQLQDRKYLNRFMIALNLYRASSTIHGNTWQYGLPKFNNYSSKTSVTSTRLMLDAKPGLFTYHHFSPYAVIGFGVGWTSLSYRETASGVGVDPTSVAVFGKKTTVRPAYDLGAGLSYEVNKNLACSLEYLYSYLGPASPQNGSHSEAMTLTSPKFNLSSQAILLGLTWTI